MNVMYLVVNKVIINKKYYDLNGFTTLIILYVALDT